MLKNVNNELFNDNYKNYVNTQLNRGNNHTIDTNNFGNPFNSYDNSLFTNVPDSVQSQIIFTPFDSDNNFENQLNTFTQEKDIKSFISIFYIIHYIRLNNKNIFDYQISIKKKKDEFKILLFCKIIKF
jgi:hypothetical protein